MLSLHEIAAHWLGCLNLKEMGYDQLGLSLCYIIASIWIYRLNYLLISPPKPKFSSTANGDIELEVHYNSRDYKESRIYRFINKSFLLFTSLFPDLLVLYNAKFFEFSLLFKLANLVAIFIAQGFQSSAFRLAIRIGLILSIIISSLSSTFKQIDVFKIPISLAVVFLNFVFFYLERVTQLELPPYSHDFEPDLEKGCAELKFDRIRHVSDNLYLVNDTYKLYYNHSNQIIFNIPRHDVYSLAVLTFQDGESSTTLENLILSFYY